MCYYFGQVVRRVYSSGWPPPCNMERFQWHCSIVCVEEAQFRLGYGKHPICQSPFGLRGDAHTHSEQSHQLGRKRTTITCCLIRANQWIIQRPNRSLFIIAEMMTIDPFKMLHSERSNAEEWPFIITHYFIVLSVNSVIYYLIYLILSLFFSISVLSL